MVTAAKCSTRSNLVRAIRNQKGSPFARSTLSRSNSNGSFSCRDFRVSRRRCATSDKRHPEM